MRQTILIEPRDPVIFRDARPSESGLPIRSIDWPLPSVIIGAIRTQLGRHTGYDGDAVKALKAIKHTGPVLAVRRGEGAWELAFPAPADAVLFRGKGPHEVVALRPRRDGTGEGEGTNMPAGILPLFGAREEKPQPGPSFWTANAVAAWLSDRVPKTDDLGPRFRTWGPILDWIAAGRVDEKPPGTAGLVRQRRIHLEVEPQTFAAKKGMLFGTEGLEFAWIDGEGNSCQAAICSRISDSDDSWTPVPSIAPLGGERRLAYWSENSIQWPEPAEELKSTELIRLQLVTPAAFQQGWKPGWLGEFNRGSPPGFPDMELQLISAAVPRAVAHSGWDLTKPARVAQKPTRFLAPAGSVYFFKATGQTDARRLSLCSICDNEQDRLDGFGVVVCGGWKWQSE